MSCLAIEEASSCRKLCGAVRALDGGDVEPFVRGDQIDFAIATGRIHHAELEKNVGLCGVADTGIRAFRNEPFFELPVQTPRAEFFRVSLVPV